MKMHHGVCGLFLMRGGGGKGAIPQLRFQWIKEITLVYPIFQREEIF